MKAKLFVLTMFFLLIAALTIQGAGASDMHGEQSFPIITDDIVDYDDLIALLGEPDEIIVDLEYGTKDLCYSNYNRAFRYSDDYGFLDATAYYTAINGIRYGMSAEEVEKIIGEPSSMSKAEEDYYGSYWYQWWTYEELGITVSMHSSTESMSNARATAIHVHKDSKAKLSCGIGIGSTRDEVMSALCIGMYPEDSVHDEFIDVGIDGGFILYILLENEKAVKIYTTSAGD